MTGNVRKMTGNVRKNTVHLRKNISYNRILTGITEKISVIIEN